MVKAVQIPAQAIDNGIMILVIRHLRSWGGRVIPCCTCASSTCVRRTNSEAARTCQNTFPFGHPPPPPGDQHHPYMFDDAMRARVSSGRWRTIGVVSRPPGIQNKDAFRPRYYSTSLARHRSMCDVAAFLGRRGHHPSFDFILVFLNKVRVDLSWFCSKR